MMKHFIENAEFDDQDIRKQLCKERYNEITKLLSPICKSRQNMRKVEEAARNIVDDKLNKIREVAKKLIRKKKDHRQKPC